jgi:predicted RNA binding protein YcfA (HicA-like mRNA interferase family)
MSRLVLANFREFEKILYRLGFVRSRQNGSHVVYHHNDGRMVSVPNHGSRDLSRKLIRRLIKQIGVSIDEYNDLIN